MPELIHHALSESIIGSAIKVLNTLRPGIDEKLYENALVIELRNRGHRVEQKRHYPVHYDGQLVGTLIPDVIVDELVIVDPKVVSAFRCVQLHSRLPTSGMGGNKTQQNTLILI